MAGLPGHYAPRAVFLRCPQAPDVRHHGRYGPEGQFFARFLVAFPQVQLAAMSCGGESFSPGGA